MAALDVCALRKDVHIGGEGFRSVARWADAGWSFESRHTGLDSVIRVTADAILPLIPDAAPSAALRLHAVYDYLERRRLSHQRLRHQGALALDLLPSQLPAALVNQYFDIKSSGRL